MTVIKYLKSTKPREFIEKILADAKKAPSVCYSVVIMRPSLDLIQELKSRIDYERQRNLRGAAVDSYLKDMDRKLWQMTGAAYVLGIHGRLLDGQHRAEAQLRLGIPVSEIVLTVTKDPDAYSGMDLTSRRTLRDLYKNRTGQDTARGTLSGIVFETLDLPFKQRDSVRYEESLVLNYDQLHESAMLPRSLRVGEVAAALRACRLDLDLALPFFEAVSRGEEVLEECGPQVIPLILLRNAWDGVSTGSMGDISSFARVCLGLTAFRAYYEDRPLSAADMKMPKLGWRSGIEPAISRDYIRAEKKNGYPHRKAVAPAT
jgi:hypothetical protein